MYQCMSRGSSFDFFKSVQVTALEVATAMSKLPEGMIGTSIMENIADYTLTC